MRIIIEQEDMKNGSKNKVKNNEKLLLSDVIGSNWNSSDYINKKVKNIIWNTDRKFNKM